MEKSILKPINMRSNFEDLDMRISKVKTNHKLGLRFSRYFTLKKKNLEIKEKVDTMQPPLLSPSSSPSCFSCDKCRAGRDFLVPQLATSRVRNELFSLHEGQHFSNDCI
jgi:hypothetical protein